MKNSIVIIIIVSLFAGLTACEKSKDFVMDNAPATGLGYRPVSTNTLRIIGSAAGTALDGSKFSAGTTVTTELQFFSESPIREINLYSTVGLGTRSIIKNYPYAPAFSTYKGTDTLLVPYTVQSAAVGTKIKLEYEILNQNSLNLIKTATITIQ